MKNLLITANDALVGRTGGQGAIVIGGVTLASSKKIGKSGSVWWDATEPLHICRVSAIQLMITPIAEGDNSTVKNWSPCDLGFTLGGDVEEITPPAPVVNYFGDKRANQLDIQIRRIEVLPANDFIGASAVACTDANWGLVA